MKTCWQQWRRAWPFGQVMYVVPSAVARQRKVIRRVWDKMRKQCRLETDPKMILTSLFDTVSACKGIRLQWEPKGAALGETCTYPWINQFSFWRLHTTWSTDSDAAIRTVCLQNPAAGSHAELKTSQASCANLHRSRQYYYIEGRKKKKTYDGLLHFWQTHSGQKRSPQALLAKGNWQSVHSLLQSTLKSKWYY